MANRIDYAMSVTAIEDGTHATTYSSGHTSSNTSGVDDDFVNPEIGRSLGGGKADTTWTGTAPTMWDTGVCTCVTSDSGTTGALSSVEGLWIKHTGFDFDNSATGKIGSTVNTAKLIVSTGSTEICRISPGGCLFLEDPANATINFTDDGTPCAVEYAILK
jgi:hypothetical protein